MAKVFLNRNRKKRLELGHPWVYKSEIDRVEGALQPGDIVDVVNHSGHFLAKGMINPNSQITVRVLTYNPTEEIDESFFERRIRDAWEYRLRLLEDTNACRVIYGEADFLPGIVVDKFADVLVIQILSLGMEVRRNELIHALIKVLEPKGIYERSDVPVREREGLEQRTGLVWGEAPREVEIVENGLRYVVDIVEGQKTGFFFDQRENRAAIAPLMTGWGATHGITLQPTGEEDEQGELIFRPMDKRGKVIKNPFWAGAEVLECFSHTGSFTLNACKHGAKKVTCLDISEHAIETAKRNVTMNGFLHRVNFVVANAFDYLREQVQEGNLWDVVILDPPAFAKTKGAVQGACRGYKDINLNGMKLVRDGGFLVTASCSYHMKPELFKEVILDAAIDAKKILRLVHWGGAGKDHPEIHGVEEGHYLKFAIFEVRSR
ncbi:class I SAM-dependent rRNA methyltransferase [Effusibacillus consociatus]|uniref:Class I SAM-dependent rRNA methyltransferase n=1 Tax=Effusibacillus consociatus TaxID=1117041 RepID=A0ABV9Q186_9BACL